eukprot:jgi/Botrbrau1/8591/Bobra.0380s0012.1
MSQAVVQTTASRTRLYCLHVKAVGLPAVHGDTTLRSREGARGGQRGSSKRNAKRNLGALEAVRLFPDTIGVDKPRLRMKGGGEDSLQVTFLPFTTGLHHCCLVFEDGDCGSFMYELVGEGRLPLPSRPLTFQVGLESGQLRDVSLTWANPQLEAARRLFLERHPLAKNKEQARLATQDLMQPLFAFTAEATDGVEVASSVPMSPATVPALTVGSKTMLEKCEGPPTNVLRLLLQPRGPGVHRARVLLTSPNDVRVLDVEFNAQPKGQTATLEMRCPARQSLVQEVPVSNDGEAPLTVVGECRGSEAFSGPKDVTVLPGQTGSYTLLFQPSWTGEENTYMLEGKAGEPMRESHIKLRCAARQVARQSLQVPNVLADKKAEAHYRVMTDLDCFRGSDSLIVPPAGTGPYEVQVRGGRPGLHVGTITFLTDSGHYVWYTAEVEIEEAAPVAELCVDAVAGQAVEIEVLLNNSLDVPAAFQVRYDPETLLGPSSCTLRPQEKSNFAFFFAPLVPQVSAGHISFSHEELGDFTYALRLTAKEAAPVELPPLTVPVGNKGRHVIELQNPLNQEVVLEATSSCPHMFSVPMNVVLPALGAVSVPIEYTPCSVGVEDRAKITLQHEKAGSWLYTCIGRGAAREGADCDPVTLQAIVGEEGTAHLAWTNPFQDAVTVDVSLLSGPRAAQDEAGEQETSGNTEDGVFQCLSKKMAGHVVPGRGLLTVPISYRPQFLQDSEAVLLLSVHSVGLSEALVWRYPLLGTPEAASEAQDILICCQERRTMKHRLRLQLPGLQDLQDGDLFEQELVLPANKAAALRHALSIEPLLATLPSVEAPLEYTLTFSPKKAVTAKAELVIRRQGRGGRWRFQIQLETMQSETDGVLRLAAAPSCSVVAPIHIYSPSDFPLPFTARFTQESSMQFDVTPKSGMLPVEAPGKPPPTGSLDVGLDPLQQSLGEQELSEGAQPSATVWVKYTAPGYGQMGRALRGRLMVQTDEASWSWDVLGVQPSYMPPDKSKMKSHVLEPLASHSRKSRPVDRERP